MKAIKPKGDGSLRPLLVAFLIMGTCLPVQAVWAAQNKVSITTDDSFRYIQSNGIPDHPTGQFPNSGNPNAVSEQNHRFRVPLYPILSGRVTEFFPHYFGVALNGVPFDPGTAEFWQNDPDSGWNYEALSGKINLGLDRHHAHVQPDGSYHYHGIPTGLVSAVSSLGVRVHVGYAADGFPIFYQANKPSSYRLKQGARPSGPGGIYDGTFVQDYEYVEGASDLDECNGIVLPDAGKPEGMYSYFLTGTFPFVPRCLRGFPDSSFQKQMPHTGRRGKGKKQSHDVLPHLHGGPPPPEAREACTLSKAGDACYFYGPRGPVHGVCLSIDGKLACVPGLID